MKALLFFLFFFVSAFYSTESYAMFVTKKNRIELGRPRFRKPKIGSLYMGASFGIPVYSLTNISGMFSGANLDSFLTNTKSVTSSIPIGIPIINGVIGYLPLDLPMRHELSFGFINNPFQIYGNNPLILNGNQYTSPIVSMQMFFFEYYMYGCLELKQLPIILFIAGGGGMVLINSAISDSATSYKNSDGNVIAQTSPKINNFSVAGTFGVSIGGTYNISDGIALQLKTGYKAISAPVSNSMFPFIHILHLDIEIFFKLM